MKSAFDVIQYRRVCREPLEVQDVGVQHILGLAGHRARATRGAFLQEHMLSPIWMLPMLRSCEMGRPGLDGIHFELSLLPFVQGDHPDSYQSRRMLGAMCRWALHPIYEPDISLDMQSPGVMGRSRRYTLRHPELLVLLRGMQHSPGQWLQTTITRPVLDVLCRAQQIGCDLQAFVQACSLQGSFLQATITDGGGLRVEPQLPELEVPG